MGTKMIKSPDEILKERGLSDAAAEAGWYATFLPIAGQDTVGWGIPFYRGGEEIGKRWKNANPNAAKGDKCRWVGARPKVDYALYYLLPDTTNSITEEEGDLFLAGGEPDVITFRAAGKKNVTCWFDGERSMPKTFIEDMQSFGVKRIFYFPDRDEAGTGAAEKIHYALVDSGIKFDVYELPYDHQDAGGGDVNRLWQDCKMNKNTFWQTLRTCNPKYYPPKEAGQGGDDQLSLMKNRRNDTPQPSKSGWDRDRVLRDYIEQVKQAMQSKNPKQKGIHFQCISPTHADNNPSARVSYKENTVVGIYICTCGKHSWYTVGEWLGIEWKVFNDAAWEKHLGAKAQEKNRLANPYSPSLNGNGDNREPDDNRLEMQQYITPELLNFGVDYSQIPIEKILFSFDDAANLYKERRRGNYIVKTTLAPFPFQAFHHLGGVWQVSAPGDVFGFLGLSGFGKTSFVDSMIDLVRQNDEHCLLISPEIPWWKMADRFSQRWEGPTVTESQLDDLYQREERDGEVRFGKKLAPNVVRDSLGNLEWAQEWGGKLYTIDSYGANVMWLFAAVYKAVAHLRQRYNIRISRIFLDYIQLMQAPKEYFGKMGYEQMLTSFNALIRDLGMVGYVPSQVRKTDTRDVMSGKGKMYQDSGMNIRDFVFKGFATMTPGFDKDDTGKRVVQPWTRFDVTKNSEGRRGEVELATVWPQMKFLDHAAGAQRANIAEFPSTKDDDDD